MVPSRTGARPGRPRRAYNGPGRLRIPLWAAPLALAALVALSVAAVEYARYCFGYDPHRFRPESLEDPFPGPFYVDWRGDVPNPETLRDLLASDGVVGSNWNGTAVGQAPHDPLRVIQIGLSIHDQILDGSHPEYREHLRRQVAWLCGPGLHRLSDGTPVWRHPQPFDRYGLEAGWTSAIIQGQAVSLLLRSAALLSDSTHGGPQVAYAGRPGGEHSPGASAVRPGEEPSPGASAVRLGEEASLMALSEALAAGAAASFRQPDLPLVWRGRGGEIFLEEFPSDPPSHALNGCLLAWLGLWDYARWTGREEDRLYCLELLDGIELMVPRFELGDWTRYDLRQERPTSPFYQALHAGLAESLHAITGRPFWGDRAERWRAAVDDPWMRTRVFFRVAWAKARDRLGV